MTQRPRLTLRDVRRIFRLVAEVRRVGDEPNDWRPFMVRELVKLFRAELVVSSELYVLPTAHAGAWDVVDIGWSCDASGHTWRIESTNRETDPKVYDVVVRCPRRPTDPAEEPDDAPEADDAAEAGHASDPAGTIGAPSARRAPIARARPMHPGSTFILSSQPLPHVHAIDQLGIHRGVDSPRFASIDHRLVRLLHAELGRFWRADELKRTRDPHRSLAPRLRQTLDLLVDGQSEKQIALELSISPHTVHNYVKALHARFKVCSRGELIAMAHLREKQFVPRLSRDLPTA